jgi:hypothetical protein
MSGSIFHAAGSRMGVACVLIVVVMMVGGISAPITAWVSNNPNPSQIGDVLTEGAGYFSRNVTSAHFYYPDGTELGLVRGTPDYICWVSGSTYYSQSGDTGELLYSGSDATEMLQNTLDAMSGGGSVYIKHGVYMLNGQLTIPYGLSFYLYGDGIPSFPYPFSYFSGFATPSDGTQLRWSSSFLSTGAPTNLISRGMGETAKGVLGIFNMAFMPAWGTTSAGTEITCINDRTSAILIEDNILFAPWGWSEANKPQPSVTNNKIRSQYMAPTKAFGTASAGAGTEARIGGLIEIGLYKGSVFNGYDDVTIQRVVINRCAYGVYMNGVWDNRVCELSSYECSYYPLEFSATGGGARGNWVGIINLENPTVVPMYNYAVYLGATNFVKIDYVYNWVTIPDAKYTQITNIPGDAQLEGTTYAYNMGNNGLFQSFPLVVKSATPFGDTIANPFSGSSPYSVGSGGANPNPVSGRLYTANTPIDVSIGAGTGQTILVKDAQGNTVESASTLNHRLMLPGYTITATYGALGSVTVVQATVGQGGTSSSPRAGVNYVVYGYAVYVTSSGGTGVSISTYDGSSNTRGDVMDSSLASMTRYRLDLGQIINFGDFGSAPTTTIVRAK